MPGLPPPDALRGPLVAQLRAAGCVFAEDEAELLLSDYDGDITSLVAQVARRVAGEPLEYILGWAEFCGMRVAVTPGVFVPRRRTEVLVREAARLLAATGAEGRIALDLCCGSGAIAAAILAWMPSAEVYATDVDPAAVECARVNVELAGGHVFAGDLFDALPRKLEGRVSVVAANAPYVPTEAIAMMPPEARDYEHRIALDGGADGTDLHRRIAAEARAWLAPGGHLLIEAGRDQAVATASYMAKAGFNVRVVEDDEYDATVVIGEVVIGDALIVDAVTGDAVSGDSL